MGMNTDCHQTTFNFCLSKQTGLSSVRRSACTMFSKTRSRRKLKSGQPGPPSSERRSQPRALRRRPVASPRKELKFLLEAEEKTKCPTLAVAVRKLAPHSPHNLRMRW